MHSTTGLGLGLVAAMAAGGVQASPAPAVIAALAPSADLKDARGAVVIGPHGEAYEPDGNGAWVRHHAGGLADEVVRATRVGARVIAAVDGGPPYAYRVGTSAPRGEAVAIGTWNLVVLGLHAKAIVGRGARVTATFGKQVFGLDGGAPVRLADAPDAVLAIGASGKGVVIATAKGLARLDGARWKPIAKAPAHVIALLDDRWALVERGVLDLKTQKLVAWPAGFHVASAIAVDGDLIVAAGTQGAAPELVTIKSGSPAHEPITVKLAPIVAVVADRSGRAVVAARDGQLAIRDKAGAWTAVTVRSELPPDRPGSPPAESH